MKFFLFLDSLEATTTIWQAEKNCASRRTKQDYSNRQKHCAEPRNWISSPFSPKPKTMSSNKFCCRFWGEIPWKIKSNSVFLHFIPQNTAHFTVNPRAPIKWFALIDRSIRCWLACWLDIIRTIFPCCTMDAKSKKQSSVRLSRTMPEQSNDYRVVVFGAGGVGKSSLVLRFVKGKFSDPAGKYPTIQLIHHQHHRH